MSRILELGLVLAFKGMLYRYLATGHAVMIGQAMQS